MKVTLRPHRSRPQATGSWRLALFLSVYPDLAIESLPRQNTATSNVSSYSATRSTPLWWAWWRLDGSNDWRDKVIVESLPRARRGFRGKNTRQKTLPSEILRR